MKSKIIFFFIIIFLVSTVYAQTKHGVTSANTTINGKILCGYQGWFATPSDGANLSWKHYSINTQSIGQAFEPGACSIDLWPDMREYNKTEQYPTAFTSPDGTKATVFSSYKLNTSMLHFRWMDEYGIDGVILQRFVTNIRNSGVLRNFNDSVMVHTMKAAKIYNKAVCIMYDMTSMRSSDASSVINDWKRLVDTYKVTSGGNEQPYLYHNGKPVICLWGVGFDDGRHDTITSPASAYSLYSVRKLVDFFKNDPLYGGCAVLLGVNYTWRFKTNKPFIDDFLTDIIKMSDIINPWTVGRFSSINSMSSFATQIQGDMLWCDINGIEYMPCAFPGFSWLNMAFRDPSKGTTIISRDKGNFIWQQFETAISKGVKQIYATMFDEIDEGTALFKVANTPPNNIEGNNEPNIVRVGNYPASVFQTLEGLSSDYYLWLVGEASRMLRKEISLTSRIPIRADKFSLGSITLSSEYLSDRKYKISFTGTLNGKLFCSNPYVVAYGVPAYGKIIDSRYYPYEITPEGVILEGNPGQIVTVIRTDSEQKASGAGTVVLQPATLITNVNESQFSVFYDKSRSLIVLKTLIDPKQSATFSVFSINGSEVFAKQIELKNRDVQIPLKLSKGIYFFRVRNSDINISKKVIIN